MPKSRDELLATVLADELTWLDRLTAIRGSLKRVEEKGGYRSH